MATVCIQQNSCTENFCDNNFSNEANKPLQTEFYEQLYETTHSFLQVHDTSESLRPADGLPIVVHNGSDGSMVKLSLKITDTIEKLISVYVELRPDLKGRVNLALNGKPCPLQKTLQQLRVKAGATFITFQKCSGG